MKDGEPTTKLERCGCAHEKDETHWGISINRAHYDLQAR